MAFVNSNDHLLGRKPVPTMNGGVTAVRFDLDITDDDLVLNAVGAVGILPAGCIPLTVYMHSDKLDSHGTDTLRAAVGILNSDADGISTAADDGGAAWATGMDVVGKGGQVAVVSGALASLKPSAQDRKIAVEFTAAAATKAAGSLGLTMLYIAV